MKIFHFILFTLLSNYSFSQQLTASFSGGFQFGIGKENMVHHNMDDFWDWQPWLWEHVDLSLGKGSMINASIGYDFKQHYGLNLRASYLFGTEFTSTIEMTNHTIERTLSSSILRLNPSVTLYVEEKQFKMYADIGFILGVGSIHFSVKSFSPDTIFSSFTYNYYGGVSFGASARLGLEYQLTEKIKVFGEFNFISQSYAPKKGRLMERIINNENVTDQYTNPGSTEIEFVDEMTMDPTYFPDPNVPSQRPKHSYPFHSYGLNLGVKFILWSKKNKEESEHTSN